MKPDLDALKSEIQEYLEKEGFVVFRGERREDLPGAIHWDTQTYPDFRLFLEAAKKAGARMVVLTSFTFSTELIDETLEELDGAPIGRDDRRVYERRLREMREFEGFTQEISLSFDLDGNTYIFELETEWYREYEDLLEEIDLSVPDGDDEDEPLGGYFSNN